MRFHIVQPTAPIYTGYTTLLTLYPLPAIKKFRLQLAQQKSNFEIFGPCQKAKNRPKIEKKSNLKVDALPHNSTDRTHIYRLYHLGIPLSIPGIKKNSLKVAKNKKFNLKFSVQILKKIGNSKMFPSQIFEAEIQNFYVRASALPQLFIPESLSILAQTICSTLNFRLIPTKNRFWAPMANSASSECKHSLHSCFYIPPSTPRRCLKAVLALRKPGGM